jgi:hypothetical protein
MVVKLRKMESPPLEPKRSWRCSASWEVRPTPLLLLKAPCRQLSPTSWRFMLRRDRDSSYPGVALTRSEPHMDLFRQLSAQRFQTRNEALKTLQLLLQEISPS